MKSIFATKSATLIRPSGTAEVPVALLYGSQETVLRTYFGRREELTDEHGVFDVAKARYYV